MNYSIYNNCKDEDRIVLYCVLSKYRRTLINYNNFVIQVSVCRYGLQNILHIRSLYSYLTYKMLSIFTGIAISMIVIAILIQAYLIHSYTYY